MDQAGRPVDHDVELVLRRLQAVPVRRFGAWVSGRHGADGDAYKLYAEVPRELGPTGRREVADRLFGDGVLHDREVSTMHVVGYEPRRDRVEAYCRAGRSGATLRTVLEHHVPPEQSSRLCQVVADLAGPRRRTLPEATYGTSVAKVRGSTECVVSVYAAATELLGSEASVAWSVGAWLDRERLQLPGYRALVDHAATWPPAVPVHTLLGVGLRGGTLDLHVGLRPPPC